MTPISVAMIIQGYLPRVGGAERQLAALAPLLQARGVALHILTRRYAGLSPYEEIDGVPVHRLPIPGPKPLAALSFMAAAQPKLAQLRPDLIHAHELLSPALTALLAKGWLRVPVVAKVLRGGLLGDVAKVRSKALGEARLALLRRHLDAFIVISQEIDAELAAMGVPPERRPFIPNGVDIERFAPVTPAEQAALRTELGLPSGPLTIFTGRLAAEKRVDQLLRLWPEIRAVHPEAGLLLLGRGEEEVILRQLAGEGVHFLGRIEDVAPYLQAADLFVLPSATEGLSNALLEALATGLPALVSEVGGAADVVEHGESGWLFPADTPTALREGLLTLLGDAALRAALGQAGRARVVADYALPVIADRLRALYEQLLP